MKAFAAAAFVILCLTLPAGAHAAGESVEEIEKDLSSILREMDSIRSELDRIDDLARTPGPTMIRVEIRRGEGTIPAPATGRLVVQGRVEDEREWGKSEREIFTGGSAPLVLQIPFLPGSFGARYELSHPSWKTPPAVDFRFDLKKGETFRLVLTLSIPPGKSGPVLTRTGGE